jgi:hypothetical protein
VVIVDIGNEPVGYAPMLPLGAGSLARGAEADGAGSVFDEGSEIGGAREAAEDDLLCQICSNGAVKIPVLPIPLHSSR